MFYILNISSLLLGSLRWGEWVNPTPHWAEQGDDINSAYPFWLHFWPLV